MPQPDEVRNRNNDDFFSAQTYWELYTSLCELYPEGAFTLDRDGVFKSVNSKAMDMLGYAQAELAKEFNQLVTEDYRSEVLRRFEDALMGNPQNYYCEIIHQNGRPVQFNLTHIPIWHNGEIIGVFGIAKNLTMMNQKESELLQITKSLNLAQEIARIGSWDYDVRNSYVYCSDPLYRILGINKEEGFKTTYENLLGMVCQEDRERFHAQFERLLRTGEEMDLTYSIEKPDHTIMTAHVRAIARTDKDGNIARVIGILHDISEIVFTANRLKESEEKFETVAKNLDVGIFSVDILTGQVAYSSPAVEKLSGFPLQAFLSGQVKWEDLIYQEDVKGYREQQSRLSEGEMLYHQYRIVDAASEIKWIEDKTFPILNEKGQLIRLDGIVQDISERKRNEEKVHFFAYHDYLTELPNRRMFDQKLEQFIADGQGEHRRFALFYLDLDRFKYVNDTLGHEVGDRLLCEISKRLSSKLGESFLFRIGGDEFTIIQQLITAEDPVRLARQVIQEVEKPFQIEGYEIHITTSIGISIYPDDGTTLSKLKMYADAALYRAKELGKNGVQFFNKSLYIQSYKLFSMENDLRKALQNDEFCLYYQSRVDTLTGTIVGAEALIRWRHPQKGLVPPSAFIPLAEEIGIINEISYWVIHQVCKQLKAWKEAGYSLVPISINLPAKTLMKADLIVNIKEKLAGHSVSPSLLEIEITENSLMSNEGSGLSAIQQLREIGIAISIDDFGTGYSSIGYLKQFKVDYLKIDRSFIREIQNNAEDLTITQSIILLAKGFGLKVVAEGVESDEQRELLQSLNCHYMQGYLFSKPLPVDSFTGLLSRSRP